EPHEPHELQAFSALSLKSVIPEAAQRLSGTYFLRRRRADPGPPRRRRSVRDDTRRGRCVRVVREVRGQFLRPRRCPGAAVPPTPFTALPTPRTAWPPGPAGASARPRPPCGGRRRPPVAWLAGRRGRPT